MKTLTTNPWIESVRAAYRASPAYRAINGLEPMPGTVGAALPREPGCDDEQNVADPELLADAVPPPKTAQQPEPATPALGIELDALEIEFQNAQADRMAL